MIRLQIARRGVRTGATAVEMALVAPVILAIFFACIEFTRLVMIQHGLTNAAREGARIASLATTQSADDVETIMRSMLDSSFHNDEVLQFTTIPTNLQDLPSGTKITTEVRVDFSAVSWLPPRWGDRIVLIGNASVRRE